MADEQDRTRPGGQLVLEPRHGLDVEVVGRLVEDQQRPGPRAAVGRARARIRQPPDISASGRSIAGRETESAEDAAGLGLDRVAAQLLEPALEVAETIQAGLVIGVVGVGQGVADRGDLGFHLGQMGCTSENLIEHRAVPGLGQFLGEVPDRVVVRFVHRSGVSVLQPDDDFEQCGLADTVAADQGDAAVRAQLEGHVLEQQATAVLLLHPGNDQHGCPG